jgi:hypothetical protein
MCAVGHVVNNTLTQLQHEWHNLQHDDEEGSLEGRAVLDAMVLGTLRCATGGRSCTCHARTMVHHHLVSCIAEETGTKWTRGHACQQIAVVALAGGAHLSCPFITCNTGHHLNTSLMHALCGAW